MCMCVKNLCFLFVLERVCCAVIFELLLYSLIFCLLSLQFEIFRSVRVSGWWGRRSEEKGKEGTSHKPR